MDAFLEQYPKEIIDKAAVIKAVIFDVDGVLTDGRIIYMGEETEIKEFHVRDGQIIGALKKAGIIVGAITGRVSQSVNRRASELSFDFLYQGVKNKLDCFDKVKEEYSLKSSDIAYIGDDYPDLPLIERSMLGSCPNDAPIYVKEKSDFITKAKGGTGVLREVADLILFAQGKFPASFEA